jgi:hypothetical protein
MARWEAAGFAGDDVGREQGVGYCPVVHLTLLAPNARCGD